MVSREQGHDHLPSSQSTLKFQLLLKEENTTCQCGKTAKGSVVEPMLIQALLIKQHLSLQKIYPASCFPLLTTELRKPATDLTVTLHLQELRSVFPFSHMTTEAAGIAASFSTSHHSVTIETHTCRCWSRLC